jgi:hypothetical protein
VRSEQRGGEGKRRKEQKPVKVVKHILLEFHDFISMELA